MFGYRFRSPSLSDEAARRRVAERATPPPPQALGWIAEPSAQVTVAVLYAHWQATGRSAAPPAARQEGAA